VSRRSRIVGFGSAGLLVLAGVACAVIFSGTLGQNLAFALVAIGLVVGTSLVFYEVGLTEDRARARERRAASRAREDPERSSAEREDPERSSAEHRGRPRLDRVRGRPRRLR
jgi:hypothetical protein